MSAETAKVIAAYYAAFNAGDTEAFLSLLHENVIHDVSQGGREVGKDAFRRFLAHMDRCYDEQITDLVILTEQSGSRAAAEFMVHGTYKATDPGVPAGAPPARGQRYSLPAGAFFAIADGRIMRISNHYSLPDWLAQIAG